MRRLTLRRLVPGATSLGLAAAALPARADGLRDLVNGNTRSVAEFAQLVKRGDAVDRSPLDLFGLYLNIMVGFAGIIFVVQVVHGGYLWMTAGGNEEQVRHARDKITNGAIGVVIIFFAYAITLAILTIVSQRAGVDAGFGGLTP